MSIEKYWFVFNPLGNNPTKTHTTLKSAQEEAERLASKHQGCPIHVLELKEAYCTQPPKVDRIEITVFPTVEHLPFIDTQRDVLPARYSNALKI